MGNLNQHDKFKEWKLVIHGNKILYEDDLSEHFIFEDGILVMHGKKNVSRAISTKISILRSVKSLCMVTKYVFHI